MHRTAQDAPEASRASGLDDDQRVVCGSTGIVGGSRAILALDPGYQRTALVRLVRGVPGKRWIGSNAEVEAHLRDDTAAILVIEQIESYGMAVGKEVFETVFWAGRFAAAFPGEVVRIPRRAVKLALCHDARAKDANIRAALIDHYGPGRDVAIGTKANPGPLYGFKADLWAALAVGVTYLRQQQAARPAGEGV